MANVTIQKRKDSYQYKFEIASIEGKRKFINKSGYRTKAAALKAGLKAWDDYYNKGKYIDTTNMSVSDFLDYWVDNYARLNLHHSTIVSYIYIINHQIKPKIGAYKLQQIDTRMLQEMMNDIYVNSGFSKNYMASILKVLKGGF